MEKKLRIIAIAAMLMAIVVQGSLLSNATDTVAEQEQEIRELQKELDYVKTIRIGTDSICPD